MKSGITIILVAAIAGVSAVWGSEAAFADEPELKVAHEDIPDAICALAQENPTQPMAVRRLDTGQVLWQGSLQALCTLLQNNQAAFAGAIGNCSQILNNGAHHGKCLNPDNDCTAGSTSGKCKSIEAARQPIPGIVVYDCDCMASSSSPTFGWVGLLTLLCGLAIAGASLLRGKASLSPSRS